MNWTVNGYIIAYTMIVLWVILQVRRSPPAPGALPPLDAHPGARLGSPAAAALVAILQLQEAGWGGERDKRLANRAEKLIKAQYCECAAAHSGFTRTCSRSTDSARTRHAYSCAGVGVRFIDIPRQAAAAYALARVV